MSKSTSMNIRIDKETRESLKKFAEEIGIPASSLVNASIRQMLRAREVRFATSLEPSQYLEGIIKDAEVDYKAGRNITSARNKKELQDFLDTL